MMSNELKPCPFCGGRAYLSERMNGGYYVECESIGGCLAESGNYDTEEQAVEAWNRRVVDTDELLRIAEELEVGYFDGCGVPIRYMVSSEQVLRFEREMADRTRKAVGL